MRLSTSLALVLLAASTATIARERHSPSAGQGRPGYADPSAAIAAELAFARLAQDKGQWAAYRATAGQFAMMLAPEPVKTVDFLKDRAEPPATLKWQPYEVWSSCDGAYAVTRGAWQLPEAAGAFVTVWQRQKNGGYKWVLRQEVGQAVPPASPDMIAAVVADCDSARHGPRREGAPPHAEAGSSGAAAPAPPFDPLNASSPDGTMSWTTRLDHPDAREFSLRLKKDGQMREVIPTSVAAPGIG